MNINLLNPVVLAENYEELIDWYVKTFDLNVICQTKEGENYAELVEQMGLALDILTFLQFSLQCKRGCLWRSGIL